MMRSRYSVEKVLHVCDKVQVRDLRKEGTWHVLEELIDSADAAQRRHRGM